MGIRKEYFIKNRFFILLISFVVFSLISCKRKVHPNQEMIDLLSKAEKNYENRENVFSPSTVVKYCDSIIESSADEEEETRSFRVCSVGIDRDGFVIVKIVVI